MRAKANRSHLNVQLFSDQRVARAKEVCVLNHIRSRQASCQVGLLLHIASNSTQNLHMLSFLTSIWSCQLLNSRHRSVRMFATH